MPRRIDIELTSALADGSWTWRAAGARKPNGQMDGSLLPPGSAVGDILKVEVEQMLDGIEIQSIVHNREKAEDANILELLPSEKPWTPETVLQVLGDRHDPAVLAPLRALLAARTVGQLSLEALWALNLSGGFNDAVATELLVHPDPHVRAWSVRLLGDRAEVSPPIAHAMLEEASLLGLVMRRRPART